jgi:hypothetical protein
LDGFGAFGWTNVPPMKHPDTHVVLVPLHTSPAGHACVSHAPALSHRCG